MKKTLERLRRAKKTRANIKRLGMLRLSVHKSSQHIYVQLIDTADKVLAVASTLSQDYKSQKAKHSKSDAAAWVGEQIAKKAIALGVKKVAFDRSGFKYHGRVMRLAEAARSAGLAF